MLGMYVIKLIQKFDTVVQFFAEKIFPPTRARSVDTLLANIAKKTYRSSYTISEKFYRIKRR